jgi:Uma2 family endonuclease
MALTAGERRLVPPRVLIALRHAGVPEHEIRTRYEIAPDEALPNGPLEPLTVEDMELLPEDSYHYELWEGELVRMCATKRIHGGAAGRVVRYLSRYLDDHPIGEIYIADPGFRAGPGESLYCPDAALVTTERAAGVGEQEFFPFAPDIAIEVWSPDNTEDEMATKAANYLTHGGRAVWILRPQDRVVRVYRPDVSMQTLSGDDLLTEAILPGFAVRVADLFPA